jgi:hypothetical protein
VPRFRIKATATFASNNDLKTDVAEVFAIAPGESTSDWKSEKAMAISALTSLFTSVNSLKRVTFLMAPAYAFKVFPAKRGISKLTVEIMDMSSAKVLVREFCNDLTVMRSASAPDRFLPHDVKKPAHAVTLIFDGGGFKQY